MKRTTITLILCGLIFGQVEAQQNYTRLQTRMLEEAKALYDGAQWADASKIYRKLVDVDTAFAEVAFELGTCLSNMPGHREKAVPFFERAARQGDAEGTYALALMRHRQQRFEEEIALLTSYKQLNGRVVENAEVDRRIAIAHTAKDLTASRRRWTSATWVR